MYQVSIQSVNSFKSYRVYRQTDRQTDRHTDTFAKTIFSGSEGLKTRTFDKNGGGHILHKSNTFSDKNVTIESRPNGKYSVKNFGQTNEFRNLSERYSVQSKNNLKFIRMNLEFVRWKKVDSGKSPNQSEICPLFRTGNYFR